MNGAMTVVESCDTMTPSLEFFELNEGNVIELRCNVNTACLVAGLGDVYPTILSHIVIIDLTLY